jgi:hypothetical protein
MRWPFRRPPTELRPPRIVDSGATWQPAPTAPHLHPDRSRPRADWAKLAPLDTTTRASPPLTFRGDRFGRDTAGARSVTHRSTSMKSRSAPTGILVDILLAGRPIIDPGMKDHLPQVDLSSQAFPAEQRVAHRRPPVAQPVSLEPLTSSDVAWSLAPIDRRQASGALAPVVWTAENGFESGPSPTGSNARPTVSSSMRLVGQRGDYGEAVGAHENPLSIDASQSEHSAEPHLRYLPVAGARPIRLAPPADVVSAVTSATGIDVGDAVIVRSAEVDDRASALGALAFTDGAAVHLPSSAGAIETSSAKALIAHELTHIAQHRRLDGNIPHEDSDIGRSLEFEARSVERSFGSGTPVIPLFIRDHASVPIEPTPTGIQRRAIGGDDPFAWQHRGDPPEPEIDPDHDSTAAHPVDPEHDATHDTNHADATELNDPRERRVAWARAFEADNAPRLQHDRDTRYHQLVAKRPADASTVAAQVHEAVRSQLDSEMPYEFGTPPGVSPYPTVAGAAGAKPAGATAPKTSQQPTHTKTPVQLMADERKKAQAELDEVETARKAVVLQHRMMQTAGSTAESALAELRALTAVDAAVDAAATSHERERDQLEIRLRRERLDQTRAVALQKGTPPRSIVHLTMDELVEIRSVVDYMHPPGPNAGPIELDHDASVRVDGTDYGPIDAVDPETPGATKDAQAPTDPNGSAPQTAPTPPTAAGQRTETSPASTPGATAAPATRDAAHSAQTPDHATAPAAAGQRTETSPASTPGATAAPTTRDAAHSALTPDHATAPADTTAEVAHHAADNTPTTADVAQAITELSELDLETLSRRLYKRIRSDLRRELLIDRERHGTLADAC